MKEFPFVSVLMPVYNAEKYLKEALESILNQSYTHFELLLFNDGSTDGSLTIIQGFDDPRIRFFDQEVNSGYLSHLNKGIQLSRGKYIIRADADDVNALDRIEKQVLFMENHPEVGLCGSWAQIITSQGELKQEIKYFAEDAWVRAHLFWTIPIPHPTAIIRKKILNKHHLWYQSPWYPVEDYALWLSMASYTQMANIQESLVKIRKHDQNISITKKGVRVRKTKLIRMAQLQKLGIQPTEREWQIHMHLLEGTEEINLSLIRSLNLWLTKLLRRNQQIKAFPEEAFAGILQKHWYKHTLGYTRLGLGLWRAFVQSPLSEYKSYGIAFKLKFFVKALFRI